MGLGQATDSNEAATALQRLATLTLLLVLFSVVVTAGIAAASSTASAAAAHNNTTQFAYIDSGNSQVTLVNGSGEKTYLENSSNPENLGQVAHYDNDSDLEVAYVTDQGEIHIIDRTGEDVALANGSRHDKTKLGAGDFDGDGNSSVVYANKSDNNYLYRVENGSTPVKIAEVAVHAVAGVTDFDNDGNEDIVYVAGGSSVGELSYYDTGSNTANGTGFTSVGQSSGIGVGDPLDFDRDGEVRIPVVDGSNNIVLVNNSGSFTTIAGGADKAPVAGANTTGGAELEIVYASGSGGAALEYATLDGTTSRVKDSGGNDVIAVSEAGAATALTEPTDPLLITDFNVGATGTQNVTVTVESNKQLNDVSVDLSGAESATLSGIGADFTETSSASPYTYVAVYNGSTDGTYDGTLTKATDGTETIRGLQDSAVVDHFGPTVTNVTLNETDPAADDDDIIGPGESVTVTADVTGDYDPSTVTASATDIGIDGAVMQSSNGQFTLEATAADNNVSRNVAATVSASDGQGNSDSVDSELVMVDTAAPDLPTVSNRTVDTGDSVNLDANNTTDASAIESYEWDFGNGENATGATTSVTYSSTGTYDVTLTVTDDAGNTATERASITVESDSSGGYYGGGSSSSDSDDDGSDSGSSTGDSGSSETTTTSTEDTTTTSTDTTTTTASTDDESTTDDSDETTTDASETTTESVTNTETTTSSSSPGFGALLTVVALLGAALLVARRD